MKAVVMEIKNEYAVVLKEDGTFDKIKRDCKVGDTIDLKQKDNLKFLKTFKPNKLTKAAAVALVLVGLSGGYYNVAFASDYMTVSEGDEEITVGLNRFGKVVSVESETSEGKNIVEDLYGKGIKYDDVEDAITKISISLNSVNQSGNEGEVEVKIDAKNSKAYKRIEQQVVEAGASIKQDDKPERSQLQEAEDKKSVENKEDKTPKDAQSENQKINSEQNDKEQEQAKPEQIMPEEQEKQPAQQPQPAQETQPAQQPQPAQETQPAQQPQPGGGAPENAQPQQPQP